MQASQAPSHSLMFDMAVGVFLTILIGEWIKPIADLSELTDPRLTVPLYVAVAWFIWLDVFRIHPVAGVPLKGLFAVGVIGWMFAGAGAAGSGSGSGLTGAGLPGIGWLRTYAGICAEDFRAVASGDWMSLSPENRTFIFLAGWAMLAAVIQSILVYKKRGLWLVVVTLIYLVWLLLWPGLDTTRGILTTCGAGLLLLAVLQLERLREACAPGLLRERHSGEAALLGSGVTAVGTLNGGAQERRKRSVSGDTDSVYKDPSGPPRDRMQHGRQFAGIRFIPAISSSELAGGYGRARLWWWPAASAAVIGALLYGAYIGAGDRSSRTEPLQPDTFARLAEAWGWQPASTSLSALALEEAGPFFRAVSGYGKDDSRLGGALQQNDAVVFTARTDKLGYWRGESKSYYDGRGWTQPSIGSATGDSASSGSAYGTSAYGTSANGSPANSGSVNAVHTASAASEARIGAAGASAAFANLSRTAASVSLAAEEAPPAANRVIVQQELLFSGGRNADQLFAGGTIISVEALLSPDGNMLPQSALVTQPATGKVALSSAWGTLGYAKFQAAVPVRNPEGLRATAASRYPQEVLDSGLQLPAGLPRRVKELAASVTKREQTPYDKALAIESYLREHYSYSLTNVAVAKPGQDFVDAFLFDGGSGYCDYFSTAMVIMLRSVGVPARWVKGFAPGELELEPSPAVGDASAMAVTVRNKDAHSWVEVYFPGTGWIAFDPTPGFSGFAAGSSGSDRAGSLSDQTIPGQEDPAEPGSTLAESLEDLDQPEQGVVHAVSAAMEKLADAAEQLAVTTGSRLSRYGWFAAAVVLLLLPLTYYMRRHTNAVVLFMLLRLHRRGSRQQAIQLRILDRIWREVFKRYGDKPSSMTLRQYSGEIGGRHPQILDALVELARLYESARYDCEHPPWVPKRQVLELWDRVLGKGRSGGNGLPL